MIGAYIADGTGYCRAGINHFASFLFRKMTFTGLQNHFKYLLNVRDPELFLHFCFIYLFSQPVVQVDIIFKNQGLGEQVDEAEMKEEFGVTDVQEILKMILKTGECHLTEEERSKMIDAGPTITGPISNVCPNH